MPSTIATPLRIRRDAVPAGAAGSGPFPTVASALAVAATAATGRERVVDLGGHRMTIWREGSLAWVRLVPPPLRVVLEEQPDQTALARQRAVADPGTARFVWTWDGAGQRAVRGRFFPSASEGEDDTVPDGAVVLQQRQPRPLVTRQGPAAVVFTRPALRGQVEVGAYTCG